MASIVSWWQRVKSGEKPQTGAEFFEDVTQVRLSDHACKRYWERAPESNDMDRPDLERHLADRLAQAAFIYDGILPPQSDRSLYFIDGDLVLIVVPNQGDEPAALVTVYPVDYGFGREIDGLIQRRLFKTVLGLHKRIKQGNEEMRATHSALDTEGASIDARLAALKAEVELLEEAKRGLIQRKSEASKGLSHLNCQLAEETAKLVLSKRYSIESLAAVAKTNGKKR